MDERTNIKSPKHYALSDLARSLTLQIEKIYTSQYWVVAEISKINHYPQSGHAYPHLVEKKHGKIVADFRGFISRGYLHNIRQNFLKVTGKELGDGMQILFRCKLSYDAIHGFSLFITDIEPSFTMGEMARMRTEAIRKLKSEQLFDRNKQLYLPMLVQRIAIISVETSKGYRDFTNVLGSSPFPQSIETRLFPALLQGDAAVESIILALNKIKESLTGFDAVAIIRGGGGEPGLDCYDNYFLGRAVSLFHIPVLTGIGHATNLTVVEQVAYKNLITPTDLARHLVQCFIDFNQRIERSKRSLALFRKGWFKMTQTQLERLSQVLQSSTEKRIREERNRIKTDATRIGEGVEEALRDAKIAVQYQKPVVLKTVVKSYMENRVRIMDSLPLKIRSHSRVQITDSGKNLRFISDKLRILDPKNTLKRGFSITTVSGKPVTDSALIAPGTEIETQLWKGSLKSTVK